METMYTQAKALCEEVKGISIKPLYFTATVHGIETNALVRVVFCHPMGLRLLTVEYWGNAELDWVESNIKLNAQMLEETIKGPEAPTGEEPTNLGKLLRRAQEKLTPKLVYTSGPRKGEEVKVGDRVTITNSKDHKSLVTVDYFAYPHKPSSSGKVTVRKGKQTMEYYVSVIGAEWINRNDR
jgi:hypothetical protein